MTRISEQQLAALRTALLPLVGLRLTWLDIPTVALFGFEPSQLAVMANTLADGALPQVNLMAAKDPAAAARLATLGLSKSPGTIGQREAYPDYVHASGLRVELKGLFVDNPALAMKRPPTKREPSARIKENVTVDVVQADKDALLVVALQMRDLNGSCSPEIIDLEVFSMIACVEARDQRLAAAPGQWFGKIPKVLSQSGRRARAAGRALTEADYEKDTNFGKLKRIPEPRLQAFMRKHGVL